MFCQSLPASRDYQGLSWLSPQTTSDSSTSNDVDLHASNQSNALPPENNNDAQSLDQSEDGQTDSSAPLLSEEHLSSDALMTDEVRMDDKKNEERRSKDVENDKHTLM